MLQHIGKQVIIKRSDLWVFLNIFRVFFLKVPSQKVSLYNYIALVFFK